MAYLDTWSVVSGLPAIYGQPGTDRYFYLSTMISGDGVWYACLVNQKDGPEVVNNVPFYRSTDEGRSWSAVSGIQTIYDCCASSDGSIVYAADLYLFKIYKSTDHGVNFSEIYTSDSIVSSLCCSDDGDIVYAITGVNRTVLKSTDGGSSFSTVLTVTAPEFVRDISCSSDGSKITIASTSNKFYISTNGGSTFNSTPPNSGGTTVVWRGIVSRDGSTIYAGSTKTSDNATTSFLHKSSDDGATWTAVYSQSKFWRGVTCSADGVKVLAFDDVNFFSSDDAGSTWNTVWTPPVDPDTNTDEWVIDSNATKGMSPDGSLVFMGGYGVTGPWRSPSLEVTETDCCSTYRIDHYTPGTPSANQLMVYHAAVATINYAAGLLTSKAASFDATDSTTVYSVRLDGVEVGSVKFIIGSHVGIFDAPAAFQAVPGSLLSIVAPAVPDASQSDVTFTLVGTCANTPTPSGGCCNTIRVDMTTTATLGVRLTNIPRPRVQFNARAVMMGRLTNA